MSEGQLYRLRAPSTGRELLLAAEPGRVYTDQDTGEELEVVGKVLPLHAVEVKPAMGRGNASLLQLVRSARPEGSERLPHVRPPYGRAAPLRGGRRMRLAPRFAAAITLLVLSVAGCGGANVAYREVPGGPVELEVPGDGAGRRRRHADAHPGRRRHGDAGSGRRGGRHALSRRRPPRLTPAPTRAPAAARKRPRRTTPPTTRLRPRARRRSSSRTTARRTRRLLATRRRRVRELKSQWDRPITPIHGRHRPCAPQRTSEAT